MLFFVLDFLVKNCFALLVTLSIFISIFLKFENVLSILGLTKSDLSFYDYCSDGKSHNQN